MNRIKKKTCRRNLKCWCRCLFFVSFSPTCGCHSLSPSLALSLHWHITLVIILFSFALFAFAWAIISFLWLLSIYIQVLPVHRSHLFTGPVLSVTTTTAATAAVVVDDISLSLIHMFSFHKKKYLNAPKTHIEKTLRRAHIGTPASQPHITQRFGCLFKNFYSSFASFMYVYFSFINSVKHSQQLTTKPLNSQNRL